MYITSRRASCAPTWPGRIPPPDGKEGSGPSSPPPPWRRAAAGPGTRECAQGRAPPAQDGSAPPAGQGRADGGRRTDGGPCRVRAIRRRPAWPGDGIAARGAPTGGARASRYARRPDACGAGGPGRARPGQASADFRTAASGERPSARSTPSRKEGRPSTGLPPAPPRWHRAGQQIPERLAGVLPPHAPSHHAGHGDPKRPRPAFRLRGSWPCG